MTTKYTRSETMSTLHPITKGKFAYEGPECKGCKSLNHSQLLVNVKRDVNHFSVVTCHP